MNVVLSAFTYFTATLLLMLAVFTNSSTGVFKEIPFKTHRKIELSVVVLLSAAFYFRIKGNSLGFYFYTLTAGYTIAVTYLANSAIINFNSDPAQRYHIF